jgi:hypothetical protein
MRTPVAATMPSSLLMKGAATMPKIPAAMTEP